MASLPSLFSASYSLAPSMPVAAALPAGQMPLEVMRVQMQMLQLQLRLKEYEAGAKAAEAALTLKLKDKDIEIAKITAAKKADVYEVQLKDIANQELGLEDKILSLQGQLQAIDSQFPSVECKINRPMPHGVPFSMSAFNTETTSLKAQRDSLLVEKSSLERALAPLISKRDSLAAQRAEIYRNMR